MNLLTKMVFFMMVLFTFSYTSEVNNLNLLRDSESKNQKTIMIFFHIPGCPYCTRMLKENFQDEKILELIKKNFILVDVYTANKEIIVFEDFKGGPKEFANFAGAFAYPATIYIDKEGQKVFRSIGYRNSEEYIQELKYVISKSYESMTLEAFKEKLEWEEE